MSVAAGDGSFIWQLRLESGAVEVIEALFPVVGRLQGDALLMPHNAGERILNPARTLRSERYLTFHRGPGSFRTAGSPPCPGLSWTARTAVPTWARTIRRLAWQACGLRQTVPASPPLLLVHRGCVGGAAGGSGTPVYRAAFYMPAVTATVGIVVIWTWLLNPEYGLVNFGLAKLGVTNLPQWSGELKKWHVHQGVPHPSSPALTPSESTLSTDRH